MGHKHQRICHVGKTFRIRNLFAFKIVYFDPEIRNPSTFSSPLFVLHQIYLCRCWQGHTHVLLALPGAYLLIISIHAYGFLCLPPSLSEGTSFLLTRQDGNSGGWCPRSSSQVARDRRWWINTLILLAPRKMILEHLCQKVSGATEPQAPIGVNYSSIHTRFSNLCPSWSHLHTPPCQVSFLGSSLRK